MYNLKLYHVRVSDRCANLIPERIGTYVMTHTYDNVHAKKYVGSTSNLCRRMYGHWDRKIIYIDLYITDDIDLAHSLERILIELIRPATNIKISPLSNEDKEIMNELLKDVKIREYMLDNIVKIKCRYLKLIKENKRIIKTIIGKRKFTKSLLVDDYIHLKIVEKQSELIKKGIKTTMSDITARAIIDGLDKITADNS